MDLLVNRLVSNQVLAFGLQLEKEDQALNEEMSQRLIHSFFHPISVSFVEVLNSSPLVSLWMGQH